MLLFQIVVATLDVGINLSFKLACLCQGFVRARREIIPLRLTHSLNKVEELKSSVTHRFRSFRFVPLPLQHQYDDREFQCTLTLHHTVHEDLSV